MRKMHRCVSCKHHGQAFESQENYDGYKRQNAGSKKNIKANGVFKEDGKTLLHNYITTEELRACTSCSACVEECPVSINPLDIIFELRRSLVMEESNAPAEWNAMFSNIENNFAPWKFSPDERDKWTEEL